MTEKNTIQSTELKDQLAEITETMKRENIEFSPEMKAYFDENLARLTNGMAKGIMPTKKHLDEFISNIKEWIEMPKRYREQRTSIELMKNPEYKLTKEQKEELLNTLKIRFEANTSRHNGIEWVNVEARLNAANPEKLWSLKEMEVTGGEPDVVNYYYSTGEFEFFDCSAESPSGRRNICYDREGQKEAKKRGEKPAGNAVDMAAMMRLGGILNKDQYGFKLQVIEEFDKLTRSWILTTDETRERGIATFAYRDTDDFRENDVYIGGDYPYFYNVNRGFRGWLRV